jgi:hypothetical protein
MKYYSNKIFYSLNIIYILAIVATIFLSYVFFAVSGMGCSLGCPKNYTEEVTKEILPPTIGIILFLICSFIILFLQQYKNRRLGYLMAILAPIGLYILYKIYSFIPIWDFIYLSFKDLEQITVGILWIGVSILEISTVFIPFYVLGRLIKEDLLKK